jgi:hypothetical protein
VKKSKPKKPTPVVLPWYDPKDPAAILCRLADSNHHSIKYIIDERPDLIKKARIKITPEIVSRAHALERQWEAHARTRVDTINRMDLAKQIADDQHLSPTLRALLTGQKVSNIVQNGSKPKPSKTSKK